MPRAGPECQWQKVPGTSGPAHKIRKEFNLTEWDIRETKRKKAKKFRRKMAELDVEIDKAQAAAMRSLADIERLDKEMEEDSPEWRAFLEEVDAKA